MRVPAAVAEYAGENRPEFGIGADMAVEGMHHVMHDRFGHAGLGAGREFRAPFGAFGIGGIGIVVMGHDADPRSEEHTSELQSLMRISYAVFCLKKKI